MKIAEAGIETLSNSGGDLAHSQQGGAESGAVGTIAVSDDPRLLRLIDAWPMLAEDTRNTIARLAADDLDETGDSDDLAATSAGKAVSR